MENGRWKMEKRPYSADFAIFHFSFSIPAGRFFSGLLERLRT
jgi:hypothetical protein